MEYIRMKPYIKFLKDEAKADNKNHCEFYHLLSEVYQSNGTNKITRLILWFFYSSYLHGQEVKGWKVQKIRDCTILEEKEKAVLIIEIQKRNPNPQKVIDNLEKIYPLFVSEFDPNF